MVARGCERVRQAGENIAVAKFDQRWFLQHEIWQEGETEAGFFTPFVVQQATKEFTILLMENRLQVSSIISGAGDPFSVLSKTTNALLNSSSDAMLPVVAIGVNFAFIVSNEEQKDFGTWNKSILPTDSPILAVFTGSDARLEIFAKQRVANAVATAEIRPVARTDSPSQEGYHVKLNFHRDCRSRTEALESVAAIQDYRKFADSCIAAVQNTVDKRRA